MNKVIIYSILLLMVFSCGPDKQLENEFVNKVITLAKDCEMSEEFDTLIMQDITQFEWDKMYVIDEYSNSKDISNAIGFRWFGSKVPSHSQRILFTKNNKRVVSFFDLSRFTLRSGFYLCDPQKNDFCSIENAKFTVIKEISDNVETFYLPAIICSDDLVKKLTSNCGD